MPESYTTPFVATTNSVIASSDHNASYGGNIRYFRQFLTNPDNANQWLQSTSADGADWVDRATAVLAAITAMTDGTLPGSKLAALSVDSGALEAGAAVSNIGYTPVNPAGAAITEDMTVSRSAAPTTGYIGLGNSLTRYIGSDGTNVVTETGKVWTAGNDGPGSGLAADTAVTATTATSATTAATATNALALQTFTWKQGKTGEFSGSQALTTSYADVAGASFSADRDGQWFVILNSEMTSAIGDGTPAVQIVSGGVSQEEGLGTLAAGVTTVGPAIAVALVTVSGTTTIKAQVKKQSGSAGSTCGYVKITGTWLAP